MLFLAIIIITNHCSLVNATFVAALSSSYYPGETAIRIDFYPAGGIIPSTHPSIPHRGASGSPLVRLRNHGSDQRRTPRATTLPGRSGILTHLPLVLHQWSSAHRTSSGSAHFILAGLPAWVILLGFAVGTRYPAIYVLGMRSTWQEDVQRSVLSCHRRSYYNLAKLRLT